MHKEEIILFKRKPFQKPWIFLNKVIYNLFVQCSLEETRSLRNRKLRKHELSKIIGQEKLLDQNFISRKVLPENIVLSHSKLLIYFIRMLLL